MILASIFIHSGNEADRPPLPAIVAENIESFKRHHPALPHRIFFQEDIEQLLERKFSAEVLDAFRSLRPFAYKADLARYCLLYEHGGAYADLSYHFMTPLPLDQGRPVVFGDFLWASPWDTSIGVMAFPPRHKALERAIEMVIANVQKRYYGLNPLCPTGPTLFGKALATMSEAEDLITGSAVFGQRQRVAELAPGLWLPEGENLHCLAISNRLVAVKRKAMGKPGVAQLGLANGNEYDDFWKERTVYAKRG